MCRSRSFIGLANHSDLWCSESAPSPAAVVAGQITWFLLQDRALYRESAKPTRGEWAVIVLVGFAWVALWLSQIHVQ
jgi:hypothetical protein